MWITTFSLFRSGGTAVLIGKKLYIILILSSKRKFRQPAQQLTLQWRKWCLDDARLPLTPAHQCDDRVDRFSICHRLMQCQLPLGENPQILVS
jgi:hypothetical protein